MTRFDAPLAFKPVYQERIWGGRRMADWRPDLPDGNIGESWDISDHPNGMSVVDGGPFDGSTLSELCARHGQQIVGPQHDSGSFPLLIKLIDAREVLSVQVHPDDELARELEAGDRGKTECWYILGDGGELYQGTVPEVEREEFEQHLDDPDLARYLQHFDTHDGDCFFIPARTVHAIGANTLLFEIQQSSDVTFRVSDWGRVGSDGKPRPLHVEDGMRCIDFSYQQTGPIRHEREPHSGGGMVRKLIDCEFFSLEERIARDTGCDDCLYCQIIINLEHPARLETPGGAIDLAPMRSYLVPYAAGSWRYIGEQEQRFLLAQPR